MKSILMSIRPEWVVKILNGIKKKEVRSKFPKDFVGWVYIYCTNNTSDKETLVKMHKRYGLTKNANPYGKVVARFWCDDVEEIKMNLGCNFFTKTLNEEELKKQACLNTTQLEEYLLKKVGNFKGAYAISISKLEIFDEPKELNEFYGYTDKKVERYAGLPKVRVLTSLTKAPQSWCYVEELQ